MLYHSITLFFDRTSAVEYLLCRKEHSRMTWFSSKVTVTFIDDATGESFGITEMPPADLPESFELDTTLHLGNDNWSVVDARPKTRAEYAKTKTLTLRLRRIEMVNPGTILYSLPSICDAIPGIGDQPLCGNEFILAEDDWRQFELVSNDLAHAVDDEIEKIRAIHEHAAAKVGWREIHVRTKPDMPLACEITLSDLAAALNVSEPSVGVTYQGAPSRISDGYAFRLNGFTVYGVAPDHKIRVIAFDQYSESPPGSDLVTRLQLLARRLDMDLVYWCRCVRVDPEDALFVSLMANEAA